MGVPPGEQQGCAAARMWRAACGALVVPHPEDAWTRVVEASPPDGIWHSLRNCIAYQAGVWQNFTAKGMDDVLQPAAFKLAIVLRHTPSVVVIKLLSELLRQHPQAQDLTDYILALLTDDETHWSGSESSTTSSSTSTTSSSSSSTSSSSMPMQPSPPSPPEVQIISAPPTPPVPPGVAPPSPSPSPPGPSPPATPPPASPPPASSPPASSPPASSPPASSPPATSPPAFSPSAFSPPASSPPASSPPASSPPTSSPPAPSPPASHGPAPLRDLQLFGDCELAVMAASRVEYDAHAKLVRAEYSKLTQENYVELRVKILNQFSQIPKLFHTPEFACLEEAARENIEREICTLREHLLTGRKD